MKELEPEKIFAGQGSKEQNDALIEVWLPLGGAALLGHYFVTVALLGLA